MLAVLTFPLCQYLIFIALDHIGDIQQDGGQPFFLNSDECFENCSFMYEVTWQQSGDGSSLRNITTTETSYIIEGLTPGTSYEIGVGTYCKTNLASISLRSKVIISNVITLNSTIKDMPIYPILIVTVLGVIMEVVVVVVVLVAAFYVIKKRKLKRKLSHYQPQNCSTSESTELNVPISQPHTSQSNTSQSNTSQSNTSQSNTSQSNTSQYKTSPLQEVQHYQEEYPPPITLPSYVDNDETGNMTSDVLLVEPVQESARGVRSHQCLVVNTTSSSHSFYEEQQDHILVAKDVALELYSETSGMSRSEIQVTERQSDIRNVLDVFNEKVVPLYQYMIIIALKHIADIQQEEGQPFFLHRHLNSTELCSLWSIYDISVLREIQTYLSPFRESDKELYSHIDNVIRCFDRTWENGAATLSQFQTLTEDDFCTLRVPGFSGIKITLSCDPDECPLQLVSDVKNMICKELNVLNFLVIFAGYMKGSTIFWFYIPEGTISDEEKKAFDLFCRLIKKGFDCRWNKKDIHVVKVEIELKEYSTSEWITVGDIMRELDECGISHSEKTLPGLQEKVPNNEIMRKELEKLRQRSPEEIKTFLQSTFREHLTYCDLRELSSFLKFEISPHQSDLLSKATTRMEYNNQIFEILDSDPHVRKLESLFRGIRKETPQHNTNQILANKIEEFISNDATLSGCEDRVVLGRSSSCERALTESDTVFGRERNYKEEGDSRLDSHGSEVGSCSWTGSSSPSHVSTISSVSSSNRDEISEFEDASITKKRKENGDCIQDVREQNSPTKKRKRNSKSRAPLNTSVTI